MTITFQIAFEVFPRVLICSIAVVEVAQCIKKNTYIKNQQTSSSPTPLSLSLSFFLLFFLLLKCWLICLGTAWWC